MAERRERDGDGPREPRRRNKRKGDISWTIKENKMKRILEDEVWKWWKEDGNLGKIKWTFLEHNGPWFATEYKPLPNNIKLYYNGQALNLCNGSEEIAGFYARLQSQEYFRNSIFNHNFMKDWRSFMNAKERDVICDLKKCDFSQIYRYYQTLAENRKNLTKDQKQFIYRENEDLKSKYGFCIIDKHRQNIGNFKIEPPGLFRGRGNHPKMGCIKRRIYPEDVIINCSKDSQIPKPPFGHQWKEVRHDPTVCWLASWVDNIQVKFKYILLNVSCRIRGERDWNKYETARKLHYLIDIIRKNYIKDMESKEMYTRQRAVALYFIDKLALRIGNEKWDDEADTVGCCSLRVEHVRLFEEINETFIVYGIELNFLGKDSVPYQNSFSVRKRVYNCVATFMENKKPSDSLFDLLNASNLNCYLGEVMEGLTAKVFRTYNASRMLEEQLNMFTEINHSIEIKILAYNRANKAIAILCNHHRSAPKGFEKSMEKLSTKVKDKKVQIKITKKEVNKIKSRFQRCVDIQKRKYYEKLIQKLKIFSRQLNDLESRVINKSENKEVALATSKLNYLDPRVTVAWCLKVKLPIEKIYNKTQLQKFRWAVDITTEAFVFCDINSDCDKYGKDINSDKEDEGVDYFQ